MWWCIERARRVFRPQLNICQGMFLLEQLKQLKVVNYFHKKNKS